MSFSDRLNLLINELGVSKNEFATRLGYKNNGVLYDYTKPEGEATKPGFEFFERLIHAKTGVNIHWLFTGEGPMMKGKQGGVSDAAAMMEDRKELKKDLDLFRGLVVSQQETILNLSRGQPPPVDTRKPVNNPTI